MVPLPALACHYLIAVLTDTSLTGFAGSTCTVRSFFAYCYDSSCAYNLVDHHSLTDLSGVLLNRSVECAAQKQSECTEISLSQTKIVLFRVVVLKHFTHRPMLLEVLLQRHSQP